jgi:hypothetical protein
LGFGEVRGLQYSQGDSMLPLFLVLTVALPLIWLVLEFQEKRWLRIAVGCAAIAMSYFVAVGVGTLQQLNYNAWYGDASQKLIRGTLTELKNDNSQAVIDNLEWLNQRYHPHYENRARYDELANEYVERLTRNSGK